MSTFSRLVSSISVVVLAMLAFSSFGQSSHVAKPAADKATPTKAAQGTTMTRHPYIGMWITKDGRIRQELLPNGRYDEARGIKKSAYQGRYEVRGTHIDYWDDKGFTADGTFVSHDELHHGGMTFHRKK